MDFIPFHTHRNPLDGCIYHKSRKKYTRSHPPKKYGFKIKIHKNERAAIIMLSRLGYPQNMLSQAFGRSTSFINKVLRTAYTYGILRRVDMRKLPNRIRLACSARRRAMLEKYMPLWEAFIFGEAERPP